MEEKMERIQVRIPRGYSAEEPNLFISVNGKNYLLPRGKTSLVPQEVAWELERSRRAQERLDRTVEALMGK